MASKGGPILGKGHHEDHFAEFRGHTLLKHGVLARYAPAYAQILGPSHGSIWLVDGFAGRGKDENGQPGSPLLLARTAAALNSDRLKVRMVAVELKRDNFLALQAALSEFDAELGGSHPIAYLRQGTLVSRADEIFGMIDGAPAFVFLDPFGADGLSLGLVRRVLDLEKGEVFALFSHVGIHRHLSVLRTRPRADRIRDHVEASLFPDWKDEWLQEAIDRAEQSDASLRPTQEAARRILTELFGDEARIEGILQLPATKWPTAVLEAYKECLRGAGATHITAVAVYDDDQHHTYWLIHAAKSPKAAMKMKEAVHSAINKSELPEASKFWIRQAHAVRIEKIVEAILQRFAGQEVSWTDKRCSLGTVQGYALGETPMMMDQREDLKRALDGFHINKRPLVYRFPASSG